MKKTLFLSATCSICFTASGVCLLLFLTNSFAQDSTQMALTEGAKARTGKGSITDIAFA